MVLKSYRLKDKLKKKGKKLKPLKDIATAGVTALLGTALILETAGAVRRI